MCNKCEEITPCGCNKPEICGCTTKLDLLCTFYNSTELESFGILKGMTGAEVIEKMSEYIENILQNLDITPTVIENIGNGVKVYKENSISLIEEFKTLLNSEGIIITEDENEILFELDQTWLENKIITILNNNPSASSNISLSFSLKLDSPGNPDTDPTQWSEVNSQDAIWMAIKVVNGTTIEPWKVVKVRGKDGKDGIDGINGKDGKDGINGVGITGPSSMTFNAFIRSETQPSTPTGGSFNSPMPSGWTNSIPPITLTSVGPVWTSTRIFTSDGLSPQQSVWTTPVKVGDSETIDYEFSNFTGTAPGTPSFPLNGATWHDVGLDDDIWMAVRTVKNGVSGTWSIVKIKGKDGIDGQSGTGYSVTTNNPIQSIAVGSDNTTSSELNFTVTISAYNNSTSLTPMAIPLTDSGYMIDIPASPMAGITVTKINANTLNYKISSGTVFGSSSVTSLINVYVGVAETNLKTSFVIFPVSEAEDAQSLILDVDANVIKFDSFDNLVTPTTVVARALLENYTGTVTWSSTPTGIVSGTGLIKTINSALFFSGSNTSAKIRIDTANGLYDEVTILKVRDGSGGAPGINGTNGPIPRLLEFVEGGEYENGGEYIDYAYYRSNDINEGWYTVRVIDNVRTTAIYGGGVPDVTPITGQWVKAPFAKEMSFGTVIAEQANLAGFIFRNQVLQSQAITSILNSCTQTTKTVPNLTLDGFQGIVNFADKMLLRSDGVYLYDNCERLRLRIKWDESTGVPIIEYVGPNGETTWTPNPSEINTYVEVRAVKVSSLTNVFEGVILPELQPFLCKKELGPGVMPVIVNPLPLIGYGYHGSRTPSMFDVYEGMNSLGPKLNSSYDGDYVISLKVANYNGGGSVEVSLKYAKILNGVLNVDHIFLPTYYNIGDIQGTC